MSSLARRRKRDGEEGEEGYFASVSDLMVGILFVFLLMLTVFALNLREEESAKLKDLREAEARARQSQIEANQQRAEAERERATNGHLRDLLRDAFDKIQRELDERVEARNQLLHSLERRLWETGRVRVSIDERSGVMHLAGDDLRFDNNSATLGQETQGIVQKLADALATTVPCYAVASDNTKCPDGSTPILETVLIEGHTDHKPITGGPFRDNDQLSAARALAVYAEVRRDHAELNFLRNGDGQPLLGVAGYGDRRPLLESQGNSDADNARNRRIDIRFILSSRTSEALERLRTQIRDALESKP